MNSRWLLWVSNILLVGALLLFGSIVWMACQNIYSAWQFDAYGKPYRATVIGMDRSSTARGGSVSAPVVEVELLVEHKTFRFHSHRYSSFQVLTVGDRVSLVARRTSNQLSDSAWEFEVDNAWHLWIGDLMAILLFPSLIAASLLRPIIFPARRKGSYELPDD
ncbi:MAG: hypothetical protein C0502_00505 [Opitutus sp.]|nr:hypothetical protein [Opitutus sp.]